MAKIGTHVWMFTEGDIQAERRSCMCWGRLFIVGANTPALECGCGVVVVAEKIEEGAYLTTGGLVTAVYLYFGDA